MKTPHRFLKIVSISLSEAEEAFIKALNEDIRRPGTITEYYNPTKRKKKVKK